MGFESLEREVGNLRTAVNSILRKMCAAEELTQRPGIEVIDIISVDSLETGTTDSGLSSVSFQNTGDSDILIKGVSIPSGDIIEFSASPGKVLDEISYDSQLSTILITTLA